MGGFVWASHCCVGSVFTSGEIAAALLRFSTKYPTCINTVITMAQVFTAIMRPSMRVGSASAAA